MIDMKLEKSGDRCRYVVRQEGDEIASCDFYANNGTLKILKICGDDPQVTDGALRAALFWAWNNRVNEAVLGEDMDTDRLAGTSLFGKEAGSTIDIAAFFAGGCKCN